MGRDRLIITKIEKFHYKYRDMSYGCAVIIPWPTRNDSQLRRAVKVKFFLQN